MLLQIWSSGCSINQCPSDWGPLGREISESSHILWRSYSGTSLPIQQLSCFSDSGGTTSWFFTSWPTTDHIVDNPFLMALSTYHEASPLTSTSGQTVMYLVQPGFPPVACSSLRRRKPAAAAKGKAELSCNLQSPQKVICEKNFLFFVLWCQESKSIYFFMSFSSFFTSLLSC